MLKLESDFRDLQIGKALLEVDIIPVWIWKCIEHGKLNRPLHPTVAHWLLLNPDLTSACLPATQCNRFQRSRLQDPGYELPKEATPSLID
jgi:hypothetical protein